MSGRIRQLCAQILSLFRRRNLDSDLSEELASHINMAVEDNIRCGMNPEEARRQAMIRFGGLEAAKELHRGARGLPWIESVVQDLNYAFRMLSHSFGFTLVAVVILALGIGANSAIFSLVSAVLLRPLPFPEADRLVLLWDDFSALRGPSRSEASPADYVDWRERSRSFADMAAFIDDTFNLTGSGDPEKLAGVRTTANLFLVLGMQPLLGRHTFTNRRATRCGPRRRDQRAAVALTVWRRSQRSWPHDSLERTRIYRDWCRAGGFSVSEQERRTVG